MASLSETLATLPAAASAPGSTGPQPTRARRRAALREAAMLWAMRGAMLGYGLAMLVAAEAAITALRRLF